MTSFWSPSARDIGPNGQVALVPEAPQSLTAGGTAIGGGGAPISAPASESRTFVPSPVTVTRLTSSAAAVYVTESAAAVRSCALEMVDAVAAGARTPAATAGGGPRPPRRPRAPSAGAASSRLHSDVARPSPPCVALPRSVDAIPAARAGAGAVLARICAATHTCAFAKSQLRCPRPSTSSKERLYEPAARRHRQDGSDPRRGVVPRHGPPQRARFLAPSLRHGVAG